MLMFIILGIGDWGLGIGPNPQSPIPNPQTKYILYTIQITFYKNNYYYLTTKNYSTK